MNIPLSFTVVTLFESSLRRVSKSGTELLRNSITSNEKIGLKWPQIIQIISMHFDSA
jgi:hypothetical protein